jgi:hypothetical protein
MKEKGKSLLFSSYLCVTKINATCLFAHWSTCAVFLFLRFAVPVLGAELRTRLTASSASYLGSRFPFVIPYDCLKRGGR